MKAMTLIGATLVTMAVSVAEAFAAGGGREDNSSLVIWAFLGFCALIVVAQLVPAIRSAQQAAQAERMRRMEGTEAETVAKE